ncbi:MAG: sulfate permease [Gammaproteobacteria bacterium]|nr:sulfate permease [Gammaproteobacteria bacterium]
MRLSVWFKLGVRDWHKYVPLAPILLNYTRDDFDHDLIAGLVVGMVTIPQAVAYALLAGVPPQSGLYACLVPMILYAIFGSSRQLVVGPVAVAALMVVATVSDYAPKYSDAYLGITTIVCLQAGLVLWVLRLSRMGGLVNLLSHPVITGFVNAAVILIIISQLPAFSGISVDNTEQPITVLTNLLTNISTLDPITFVLGGCALVILLAFPKLIIVLAKTIGKDLSEHHAITRLGPMIVAVFGIVVVLTAGIENSLATVGPIPGGLPDITIPPFELTLWIDLLPASAIIAIVSYVESYSIGTTLAARKQTRINSHQELIALGAANLGAAFTGAYPVAGSFSRSSVNYYAGAKTPVSSLVCAVLIVIVLLFFTNFFTALPHAVLAAIVMVSVVGLMDFKSSRRHWSIHREDVITEYATLILVLFMGVEIGLLAGVGLSIAFFIRTSSRPNITQVGRLANTEHFRSIKHHEVETLPHVLALRVDENIYFGNSAQIEAKFLKRVHRRHSTQHLLIVFSSVNMVDATGLQMLHRLNANLDRVGVSLNFCEVKGTLVRQLDAAELTKALSGSIFFSTDRAMKHFETLYQEQINSSPSEPNY